MSLLPATWEGWATIAALGLYLLFREYRFRRAFAVKRLGAWRWWRKRTR
jgi:hypothetical protein